MWSGTLAYERKLEKGPVTRTEVCASDHNSIYSCILLKER